MAEIFNKLKLCRIKDLKKNWGMKCRLLKRMQFFLHKRYTTYTYYSLRRTEKTRYDPPTIKRKPRNYNKASICETDLKQLTKNKRQKKLAQDLKQARKTTTYDEGIDRVVQKSFYKSSKIKQGRNTLQGYNSNFVGTLKTQSLKSRIQSFAKLDDINENFDHNTAYEDEWTDEETSEEDEGFVMKFNDLTEKT